MSLRRALAAFLPFLRKRPKSPPPTLPLQRHLPIPNHQPIDWQTEDRITALTKQSRDLQAEIAKLQRELAAIRAEPRFIP